MGVLDSCSAYDPGCIVCGPRARCEQGWIEGTVADIERLESSGKSSREPSLALHLSTGQGPCVLALDERFAYLADGLAQAPKGVVLRAYHLHAVSHTALPLHAGSRSFHRHTATPRYRAGPDSLVIVEPDWLVDVTALTGTDYCLRQWLAGRLAAHPSSTQMMRGTAVHECFIALCRTGAVTDTDLEASLARHGFDLEVAGVTQDTLHEAVLPHIERLRAWFGQVGRSVLSKQETMHTYESTLLCPELGLRGRVDLVLRRAAPSGRPLVARIIELKTAKYKEEWPDPEFQVRGYYAILASQGRLASDFDAVVLYTGGATVETRPVTCGPADVAHVVLNRNRAMLALMLGHAPPAGGNRCRRSNGRADCVLLSRMLGLDDCHGRDLVDAAGRQRRSGRCSLLS